MRIPSMVAIVVAVLAWTTACNREPAEKMVSFGPGVAADLTIYFKPDVTEQQIQTFWEQVLSKPATASGRAHRDGVSGLVRLPAKNGREGIAVTFLAGVKPADRQALRSSIDASPLVLKVVENAIPDNVTP